MTPGDGGANIPHRRDECVSTPSSGIAGVGFRWCATAGLPLKRSTGVYGERDKHYADLIVGPLLVEIKTGHVTSDWDLVKACRQLIDYRELGPADSYPVSLPGCTSPGTDSYSPGRYPANKNNEGPATAAVRGKTKPTTSASPRPIRHTPSRGVRPVRRAPNLSDGSGAHHEHTTLHYGHEKGSEPEEASRSEP